MEFTYQAYRSLLQSLKESGYEVVPYDTEKEHVPCVIFRHDIDFSLEKALCFAQLEQDEGVQSTYFVLVTSDFYNPFSAKNAEIIHQIMDCGHEIGLHFDEMRYRECQSTADLTEKIQNEVGLLETLTGKPIHVVSMHRPSNHVLNANLEIPGMINSYGTKYFREYKYVSDSRMRWREDIEQIVSSKAFPKLHILTHAFWYGDEERTIQEQVERFIHSANRERYETMNENIRDLFEIMKPLC